MEDKGQSKELDKVLYPYKTVLKDWKDWENLDIEEDNYRYKYEIRAREMYNETGTVPAVRVFAKEFGMDRKAKELYDVFESCPMKKIAKYGGLPKPTGCV